MNQYIIFRVFKVSSLKVEPRGRQTTHQTMQMQLYSAQYEQVELDFQLTTQRCIKAKDNLSEKDCIVIL